MRVLNFWRAAAAAAVLAVAGTAAAQAWQTYTGSGFTIETPVTPQVQNSNVPTPAGPVAAIMGMVDLGEHGAMVFSEADYSPLLVGKGFDTQKGLDGSVQGQITNMSATLDSVDNITVDGEPGREVHAHTDTMVIRSRIAYRDQHLFQMIGIGPKASGVPAEFDRFETSFRFKR